MTTAKRVHLAARLVLLAVLALGTSLRADAGLFKCATPRGGVVYQDAPCPPGHELRDLDRDPANVSVLPFAAAPAPAATAPVGRARRAADKPAPSAKPPKADTRARKAGGGDAGQRRFLRAGMSEGEVMARVGAPDLKARVRKGVRWQYLPVPEDDHTMTTVTFERGAVTDIERKIIR